MARKGHCRLGTWTGLSAKTKPPTSATTSDVRLSLQARLRPPPAPTPCHLPEGRTDPTTKQSCPCQCPLPQPDHSCLVTAGSGTENLAHEGVGGAHRQVPPEAEWDSALTCRVSLAVGGSSQPREFTHQRSRASRPAHTRALPARHVLSNRLSTGHQHWAGPASAGTRLRAAAPMTRV